MSGRHPGAAGAILMYHKVGAGHADALTVSVERFRVQMQVLADRRIEVVALQDLATRVRSRDVRGSLVSITFDDGYVQTAMRVAPILSGHAFPSTLFVVAEPLEAGAAYWWDTLDSIFAPSTPLPDALTLDTPPHRLSLSTASAADRRETHARLKTICYQLPAKARFELVEHVVAWSGSRSHADADRPMTLNELRVVASGPGVEIGAHSANHVWLPAQTAAAQEHEIAGSKATLERALGRCVATFSYPYGASDGACASIVRTSGFSCAVTADHGVVTADSDPFVLPRLAVPNADAAAFSAFLDRAFAQAS